MTDREEAAARRALEAASKAVADALLYAEPWDDPAFVASRAILAIDPAQFRTDRKDGDD